MKAWFAVARLTAIVIGLPCYLVGYLVGCAWRGARGGWRSSYEGSPW